MKILAYQRMVPEQFEAAQRQQLLAEKVRNAIREPVTVVDADIEDEYRRQNERIDLAFVRLTPANFEARVKVDDQALNAFFEEHKESFRLPETIALRYLLFDPSQYSYNFV